MLFSGIGMELHYSVFNFLDLFLNSLDLRRMDDTRTVLALEIISSKLSFPNAESGDLISCSL